MRKPALLHPAGVAICSSVIAGIIPPRHVVIANPRLCTSRVWQSARRSSQAYCPWAIQRDSVHRADRHARITQERVLAMTVAADDKTVQGHTTNPPRSGRAPRKYIFRGAIPRKIYIKNNSFARDHHALAPRGCGDLLVGHRWHTARIRKKYSQLPVIANPRS